MFSTYKLGLTPHNPVRVARVPTLRDVLDPVFAQTPRDWAQGLLWDDDVLGNDVAADCGPAALVNWLKLMGLVVGSPLPLTTADAFALYTALTGWDGVPGSPSDTGVELLSLMQYAVTTGVAGTTLDGYLAVPLLDQVHLATAVDLVGPLVVGLSLPVQCQSTDYWDYQPGMVRRSWGGHAVLLFSVSPGVYVIKTWGRTVRVTDAFLEAFGDDAYLPLHRALRAPLGIDWERLRAILAEV